MTSIAMDEDDHVFVAGSTNQRNMPVTEDALQCRLGPTAEGDFPPTYGYLAAITISTGELIYGTYLGGTETHKVYTPETSIVAMTTWQDGSVMLAGSTNVSDLPVKNALYPTLPSLETADVVLHADADFLFKFDKAMHLSFGTYFGKTAIDRLSAGLRAYDLAVDGYGNPYLLGQANTQEFPITNLDLYKPPPHQGGLFLTKFARDGSRILYSTLLREDEFGPTKEHLAVDSQGQAIVSGSVIFFDDIPVRGSLVQKESFEACDQADGHVCGYVQRFNSTGSGYVFSTFYGGSSFLNGGASAVATDVLGNVIVGGTTASPDFILVNPFQGTPVQSDYPVQIQGYVAKFASPSTVSASNLRSFVEGYGRNTSAAVDMRLLVSELETSSTQTALATLDRFDADVNAIVSGGQWATHTGFQMHEGSKLLRQQIAAHGAP